MAMIALVAGLVQPPLARAYFRARTVLAKVRVFHEMRLDAFASESISTADLIWMATNTPASFAPDYYIWQPPRPPKAGRPK
jgi:hypothetical protein